MATPPTSYPPGYLEQSRQGEVVGVAIAFIVVDTIATILRTFARQLQKRGRMWSDVFMPISLLFNLGTCTCVLLGVRWGVGKHTAAVPPEDLKPFIILSYYGIAPVYIGAVTFSKLAILDLYLHLFIDKFSRYTSYILGTITVLSAVVNVITALDQCHPIDYLWNPSPGGWCNNVRVHFTWASFPNMITDFIMLLLPIPVIIKLQATWQKKLGILITFLVGSVGLVTSIIRFYEFWIFSWNYDKKGWTATQTDATWSDAINLVWTAVEPGVYHLAACLITFRPLFRWLTHDSPVAGLLVKCRIVAPSTRASTSGVVGYSGDKGPYSGSGGRFSGRVVSRGGANGIAREYSKRLHSSASEASMSARSADGRPTFVLHSKGVTESRVGHAEDLRWTEDLEGHILVEHNFEVTQSRSGEST